LLAIESAQLDSLAIQSNPVTDQGLSRMRSDLRPALEHALASQPAGVAYEWEFII
jgi:hypothetical protein